jgi:CRP-like cAMP-binding protein
MIIMMSLFPQTNTASYNCINCTDKSCAVAVLSETELKVLAGCSSEIKINRGEVFLREGSLASHVIYLKSGLVKEYVKGPNNKDQIVQLIKQHTYLGLSTMFSSNISMFSYAALEDLHVCYIDAAILKSLIHHNGNFAYEILMTVSNDSRNNYNRYITKSQKQNYGLCADALLYFSKIIYEKNQFTLPVTHTDFAALIGATRESVTRVLSKFRSEGIIDMKEREITILKMDVLESISKNG